MTSCGPFFIDCSATDEIARGFSNTKDSRAPQVRIELNARAGVAVSKSKIIRGSAGEWSLGFVKHAPWPEEARTQEFHNHSRSLYSYNIIAESSSNDESRSCLASADFRGHKFMAWRKWPVQFIYSYISASGE